jgi:hypothetical protein
MEALLTALSNRRVALAAELAHAAQRPCTNNLEVMRLRMEKLRVEDEIRAIERMSSRHSWDRPSFTTPRLICS